MATLAVGGTTVFDGAALQSGVTGTLGSGITFPAGHVLQIQHYEVTETNSLTTTYVNIWENSITLKSGSSDIYINMTFSWNMAASASFGVKIYRNTSATVTTSHTAVWTKGVTSGAGATAYNWDAWSGGGGSGVSSIIAKDTITGRSAGDVLYYGFFGQEGAGAVVLPAADTVPGFMAMQLTEVAK